MRIVDWLKAARAPFFLDVMLCVCLGAAAAWYETGGWDLPLLLACLSGAMLLNGGTNLANDYHDHLSGADEANRHPTPFSGGSRAIQDGTFAPKAIRNAAFLCFALAAGCGAYLVWRVGWPVLVFGGIGALSGYFYTAPPFRLGYRGLGEFLAGLNVGPLAVLGAYFVQTGTLSWGVVLASLPAGFLSSALLVINEMPDARADRAAGKNHLVSRMRIDRAALAYLALVLAAFAAVGVAVASGLVPWTTSIAFAAAPIGIWAFGVSYQWARSNMRSADAYVRPPPEMTRAMAANVTCLLLSTVLLCAGYLVGGTSVG